MASSTLKSWRPGMDLPYVVSFGDSGMLAIALRAAWLKPDRSGQPLLLPPAVRAVDRLRAIFTHQEELTPGFILSLREGMGLTQSQFGEELGVSKITVSRWECGRMRPSPAKARAIRKLQAQARHEGVKIDGEKPTSRHPGSAHRPGPSRPASVIRLSRKIRTSRVLNR
ncbi:MAG TPA: helix-turn-helix domain-containing protein [Tepidisphaeraceae bacterium]|nr:helix-turn-helix domain-containing protein [Tepidisphaeraceae bacterium]